MLILFLILILLFLMVPMLVLLLIVFALFFLVYYNLAMYDKIHARRDREWDDFVNDRKHSSNDWKKEGF